MTVDRSCHSCRHFMSGERPMGPDEADECHRNQGYMVPPMVDKNEGCRKWRPAAGFNRGLPPLHPYAGSIFKGLAEWFSRMNDEPYHGGVDREGNATVLHGMNRPEDNPPRPMSHEVKR